MRILFLSQRFLMPMDTGGKIRTGNILKHLSKSHEITLISNYEFSKDEPYLKDMDDFCSNFIPIPWKEVKRHSFRFFARLALQMFSLYPVSVLNDYSRRLNRTVKKECINNQYDLAICDFVQSALMFRGVKHIPLVLFQHNVEAMILKRHFKRSGNFIPRIFWWLQWKKMAAFENTICQKFDRVVAVSTEDKKIFANLYNLKNVATIPTGVDIDYFRPMPHVDEKKHSLVFCGSMDWLPNEDAMIYFITDIFPLIKKHFSDVTLTIIGRNPSPSFKNMVEKIHEVQLTGWVEDTRPILARGSMIIVPIRIGGGTRMKIYEAMAMAKPVVSTTIGAEGLPVSNGDTIIIEDNPDKVAERIIELMEHPDRRKKIGDDARAFVSKNYSWPRVGREFETVCTHALNKHH